MRMCYKYTMGTVQYLPGTCCEICRKPYHGDGWSKQSETFGFCCSRCVNKACRLVRRHNRRAKSAGCKGRLYAYQWLCALYAYAFRCCDCGDRTELTLDHIRPLSKGGPNQPFNLQPLCQCCHKKKDNVPSRRLAALA